MTVPGVLTLENGAETAGRRKLQQIQMNPLEAGGLQHDLFDQCLTGNIGNPVRIGQNPELGHLHVIDMKRDNITVMDINIVGKRNIGAKADHIRFHNKILDGFRVAGGGQYIGGSVFLQPVDNIIGQGKGLSVSKQAETAETDALPVFSAVTRFLMIFGNIFSYGGVSKNERTLSKLGDEISLRMTNKAAIIHFTT